MIPLEEGVPFSRLTTIGTGGPARWLGRPETVEELVEVLGWAEAQGVAVETIGLGSNVLAHDGGVEALVLRLAGALASARIEGETLVAGGGASNAVCLHRAREAGLGGFEFASAIPGTAGGGLRMNAGAYGSDWSATMIDALVVTAAGARSVTPGELGLGYRHSSLSPGEVVAQVRFRLVGSSTAEVKAKVAELLAQRKATQPTTRRTFGSVFKNPESGTGAGSLIEQCGLKGFRVGGAIVSERHANFIENTGGATSADAIAVMAESRRLVHERFGVELQHEVRLLGPLELPSL
jgi:UDP-N-acetylenolpyruvoylglucosamine reductase